MQRNTYLNWEASVHVFAQWAERYCSSPLYWRLHGRPVCSILNLTDFVAAYGMKKFSVMLKTARRTIRSKLGEDPFLIGVIAAANRYNTWLANNLPVDGVTGYALLPEWQGPPIQRYEELIHRRVGEWYKMQRKLRVPFFPVACAGWDASVRGMPVADLRSTPGFPWRPVVVGVSPALFGLFLDRAIEFNAKEHPNHQIVFIHAWNEWTESSAVEPSDRFGAAFLEQIGLRASRLGSASYLLGGQQLKQAKVPLISDYW